MIEIISDIESIVTMPASDVVASASYTFEQLDKKTGKLTFYYGCRPTIEGEIAIFNLSKATCIMVREEDDTASY